MKSPAMVAAMAGLDEATSQGSEDRVGNYRTPLSDATGELEVRHV
jgi:hypothetical protein